MERRGEETVNVEQIERRKISKRERGTKKRGQKDPRNRTDKADTFID